MKPMSKVKTRVLKRWAGANRQGTRRQHVALAGWHGWARWRAAVDRSEGRLFWPW